MKQLVDAGFLNIHGDRLYFLYEKMAGYPSALIRLVTYAEMFPVLKMGEIYRPHKHKMIFMGRPSENSLAFRCDFCAGYAVCDEEEYRHRQWHRTHYKLPQIVFEHNPSRWDRIKDWWHGHGW